MLQDLAEDAKMDVSSPFAQTPLSVFYLCSADFVVILPDVVKLGVDTKYINPKSPYNQRSRLIMVISCAPGTRKALHKQNFPSSF